MDATHDPAREPASGLGLPPPSPSSSGQGRTLLVVAVIVLGVAAGAAALVATTGRATEAPDFTVTTLENETFTLSAHRDRVVVLQFMATWCATCRITDAELKTVWPTWNHSRVVVLSLDLDPWGTEEELRQYRDAHGVPWPMARDTAGAAQAYGVFELGRLLVLDGDGQIVYDKRGVAEAGPVDAAVGHALAGTADGLGLARIGLLPLAVLAGFATFFSPCAAALLPAYVTMNLPRAGLGATPGPAWTGRVRRGTLAGLGLLVVLAGVAGFLLAFGTVARAAIPRLQPIVGVAMVALGVVALARPGVFEWATRGASLVPGHAAAEAAGPRRHFWYGVAYGAAASGCVLPVVLQLGLAAALAGAWLGAWALVAYAATAALLMVAFASVAALLPGRAVRGLARAGRFLPAVAGAVFIVAGLYLVVFYWRAFGVTL